MKTPAIQGAIMAHLRGLGRPESSRALAALFLKIRQGDEETCRRLLAPFLLDLPGVAHGADGWCLRGRPGKEAGDGAAPARHAAADEAESDASPSPPGSGSLREFVALACDGGGPSGSGAAHAVSLLPVIGGEPCQEEHFPAWAADEGEAALRGDGDPAGLGAAELREIAEAVGDLPVVCHRAGREIDPIRRACAAAGVAFHPPVISAARLGHILLGLKANHATLDLAAALRLQARGPDDCRGRVRVVAESFLGLIPLVERKGIDSIDALLEFQDMPAAPLDLSRYAFTREDLRDLPAAPGVYRFLGEGGEVLYIGKAKNLRVRVSSYFAPGAAGSEKGRAILERTRRFEVQTVASDLEAALLEAALLAEHRAPLNRQFQVRERPAPYGPRLNLAVILRDAGVAGGRPTCTLHLLRGGRYAGRAPGVAPDEDGWGRAVARVADLYFRSGAARRGGDDAADGDVDWQLVSTYLRRHRDEVNVLDLDECASPEEAGARLAVLARAAAGGARVVAR